jgi:hypothetical protein
VTYSGASRVYALSSATTITGLAGASYTVTGWTEQLDTLNEFNGSTFTATNTGNYLVCANIGFDQAIAADLTQATAATFINGTRFDGIGYTLGRAAGQNLIWVNGCILEPLTAGNALTIRAGTDNAGSGVNPIVETGDGGGSNLSIIRIW